MLCKKNISIKVSWLPSIFEFIEIKNFSSYNEGDWFNRNSKYYIIWTTL